MPTRPTSGAADKPAIAWFTGAFPIASAGGTATAAARADQVRKTAELSLSRAACSRMLSAAAADCSTSAAFCCVT
jgi:hypothetical protein